jgi:hypothetical protein
VQKIAASFGRADYTQLVFRLLQMANELHIPVQKKLDHVRPDRSPMRLSHAVFAISLLALPLSAAHAAGLATTDTYTLQYVYSTLGGDYGSPVSGTLPLSVNALGNTIDVAVTGSSITFTSDFDFDTVFNPATLNGVRLTDNSGPLSVSFVTLDAASIDPIGSVAGVTFSGNSIFFNFQGNPYLMDTVTRFDFGPTTATPEPSSFVLLGTGMLGAFGAIRLRTRNQAQLSPARARLR